MTDFFLTFYILFWKSSKIKIKQFPLLSFTLLNRIYYAMYAFNKFNS